MLGGGGIPGAGLQSPNLGFDVAISLENSSRRPLHDIKYLFYYYNRKSVIIAYYPLLEHLTAAYCLD